MLQPERQQMVYKMMRFILLLFFLLPNIANAQVVQQATTGMVAPQLSGAGTPSNNFTCNASTVNLSYIQTDATNGRLWLCDPVLVTWVHLLTPVQAAATSSTITGGAFVGGTCTTTATVTVAGAVVGTNAAVATPIYATAPTGSQGLFNLTAWVSAANTVSVQGCAFGIIATVPNFQAKVLLY